jgi:hypothetical protein
MRAILCNQNKTSRNLRSMRDRLGIVMLLMLVLPFIGLAQNDTSALRKNVFTAGTTYQSKLHYFGRTDSLQSSGLFPSVGFELKYGLYTNANFIFVNNSVASTDYSGTVIEAGYKFPQSKNFSGNMYYTHFLYESGSQLVQSALKGQTGINLTWNNKILNVNTGADAKFSNKTDYGLTGGVDHLFIYVIPNTKNAIAINPSFYTYAGTQNFTNTYYKSRKVGGIVLGQQAVTENVKQFKVLAYEASLPLVLVLGKFNASLTGSYVMPQNLITVSGRPDLTENGKNMLYFSAGVGVRL